MTVSTSRQIEHISDARFNEVTDDVEFLVKWKGFSELENSWTLSSTIDITNYDLIHNFVSEFPQHPTAQFIKSRILGTE